MSDEYNCREHCLNLKRAPYKMEKVKSLRDGYVCSLTEDLCVGTEMVPRSPYIMYDNLNKEIIERCPVRKTIDNIVKEK